MKALLSGNPNTKGGSTLELLIAFAVLIVSLTAVVLVVFGNQSVSIDLETNTEAVYKAKNTLEDARKDARESYSSVQSFSTIEQSGPLAFTKSLYITDITQCIKHASSTVSWPITPLRNGKIEFETFFTDLTSALLTGGDCDTTPVSEWDNPASAASVALGGQGATGIDVRNNVVYLVSDPSPVATDDLLIYQFDPNAVPNPTLTLIRKKNIGNGLADVDVIEGYAYTASVDTNNQLKAFDVTGLPNPIPNPISYNLPNLTGGAGRTVTYYDGYVYIGTNYVACPGSCTPEQNNEFHIYQVDSTDPTLLTWVASYNVNHNINDIVVRDGYAYLATSDDVGELTVLNINNLAAITAVKFNAVNSDNAANDKDGRSLYLIGNKLYLGRTAVSKTQPTQRDFYILDVSNPLAPTVLGSKNLQMNSGSAVIGMAVRGKLAFLGLDDSTAGFRVLNISDPTNIFDHTACTTLNFSENSTALDMDGDFVFTANRSNDELRVIRDQPTSCTP